MNREGRGRKRSCPNLEVLSQGQPRDSRSPGPGTSRIRNWNTNHSAVTFGVTVV